MRACLTQQGVPQNKILLASWSSPSDSVLRVLGFFRARIAARDAMRRHSLQDAGNPLRSERAQVALASGFLQETTQTQRVWKGARACFAYARCAATPASIAYARCAARACTRGATSVAGGHVHISKI